MLDIVFEELSIQNFKSIGNDPVVVTFNSGINFISGYNKDEESFNGVGKTTIIDAFFFVLFDKTLTGITKTNLINDRTNGTSIITLKYKVDEDDYEITRSLNPSRISFLKNGENLAKTIPETNKDICSSIHGDIEVYSNSIVMNSDSRGFLTKEPAKKVKFIEQILSLGVFADMLKVAQTEFRETNKVYSKESGALSQIESMIKREIDSISKFEAERDLRIKSLSDTISSLESSLGAFAVKDVSSDIESLSDKLKDIEGRLSRVDAVIFKSNLELTNLQDTISSVNSDILNLNKLKCPSCNRPFEGHDEQEIQVRKKELKVKYDELVIDRNKKIAIKENATKSKSKLLDIKRKVDTDLIDFKKQQASYESLKEKIFEIESNINNKKILLEAESNSNNPHKDSLKLLENDKIGKEREISDISKELKVLENVKFLCSPEGVKSHIIFKILKSFNSKLSYYLKRFSAPCRCKFDQYFDYKLTNLEGKEISYFNLSGGERKRLDLSLLFTFRELRKMQSNIHNNVTMFDELFDSALDSTGIEVVLEILKEQTNKSKECIYIVTHRKEILEEKNEYNTIFLEKENGITYLV